MRQMPLEFKRNALLASSKTRRLGRKDGDLIIFFDNDGRPLLA
jgi:hypothetical protein